MPKQPSASSNSKYFNEQAFQRLLLLIQTLLRYPGVGHLEKSKPDGQHHNALSEVREYLLDVAAEQECKITCSPHTLNKDLQFLRSKGILGQQMYRWGYYLGTGALSEADLTVALNALNSQASYQKEPLVQEVYARLSQRLLSGAEKS